MNSVNLVGRIATDLEDGECFKYSPSGTAVLDIILAVQRTRGEKNSEGRREADFFNVVAFGKTAEFVATYLQKGSIVSVTGELRQERWEGGDGKKRSKIKVIANSINGISNWKEKETKEEKDEPDF